MAPAEDVPDRTTGEKSPEDLFEDLDKFFAPINEPEWTGEHDLKRAAAPPEPAASASAEEATPPPAEDAAVEAPAPLEPGPVDEEEEPGAWSPLEDLGEPVEAEEQEPGEPTGEMSREDWQRLRDVLGEEEDAPASGTFLGEAEQELPPELTLEDLKKAPPEYARLPGVEQAESPGLAEVEAAAEQMAEGYRTSEPGSEGPAEDLLAELEAAARPRTVRVGAESLGGPAWEEPTSQSVAVEAPGPRSGRNMPAAVLTGAVLVAVALVSIAVDKAAFAVVAGVVILLAESELYGTMQRQGDYQPATALGLVVGALVIAAGYLRGETAMLTMFVLGLVLSFLWYMSAHHKAREGAVKNIAVTMLGVGYLAIPGAYLLVLLAQSWGRTLVLEILGLTFFYDIAAFALGSLFGRRPLAPTISPRKSWEGLFFATVATLLLGATVLSSIGPTKSSLPQAVAVSLVVVILAPLGDLAESLIKRDLGVKDMGTILPGHGGVLDRIDSVLFVIPAVFYLLRFIF